jgi:hypothetical protein
MNRKHNAILAGVLFLCSASLLGAQTNGNGPYLHQALRFGFTPPVGWTQKKDIKEADKKLGVVVVFMESSLSAATASPSRRETDDEFLARINRELQAPRETGSAFQANLSVITRPAGGMTVEQYARETRAKAAKTPGYRILSEKQRRLGGAPAIERLIRLSASGRSAFQTREVTCVRNSRLFILTLAAPTASFARYSAEFDKSLASFVWK